MRSSDGSSDVCSSDLLAAIMRWGFEYMQDDDGGSVYLRLSTRQVEQPQRELTDGQLEDLLAGAYWQVEPAPGAELALVYSGGVVPEVLEAHRQLAEEVPGKIGRAHVCTPVTHAHLVCRLPLEKKTTKI